MSSTCASVILEVLEHKGDKTLDWKGMDERQKEAAKELLVLTHIAEAAVPIQEEACPNELPQRIKDILCHLHNFILCIG